MSLTTGTQLGPYSILAPLGAGGMGEVYRARDTRLDRDVAIKVLPDSLADDKERILRFEREAKALASLNHPNIAAIYGFEQFEGRRFLAMELAEGETLAERLVRGAIPVRDSLEFAVGIALALEAAHEKGIIHRDLKPANVQVTQDGTVKVLDFGLAKAMTGDATGTDIANSPTITMEHTRPGVVLGTAAYMSPEQARGRTLDKRTDVWSFGCVLYECLTGVRPFEGETTSDLVARILEREPDWSALPPGTPPLVQLLLRRCLAKDRNKRLRDIGDARVEIESAMHDPTSSGLLLAGSALAGAELSKRRRWGVFAALTLAVGVLCAGLGWGLGRSSDSKSSAAVYRFIVDVPSPYTLTRSGIETLSSICLSRDGALLAFTGEVEGVSRIFIRDMASDEPHVVPGTEGGSDPMFSPDGRWLAFTAGGKLKKVALAGGPALTICDSPGSEGVWMSDGTIILTTTGGRTLTRVDERTGASKVLATGGLTVRTTGGEQPLLGFQTVCEVPGADYVIAGIWDGDTIEDYATVAVSLTDGTVRPVLQDAIDAKFVAPGYLVFLRGASVLAVGFDVQQRRVIGEPVLVLDGVVSSKWADEGQFAVSLNGTLAHIPGGRRGPGRRLIRVDAQGKAEPMMEGTDAIVGGLSLSPNGKNLSVVTLQRNMSLWNYDLARRSFSLVNNVGESWSPVWTPDGEQMVFFQIVPEKFRGIVRKRADGGGAIENFLPEQNWQLNPNSFSPDGKQFLYTLVDVSVDRQSDVALHRTDQPGSPEVIVGTSADELDAMFAPDGKHFAYVSRETGRHEVFVRTIEGTSSKRQVSQAGGQAPRWARDGKKLYFLDREDWLHAVDVDLDAGPTFSTPTKLFDINTVATDDLWGVYDVLPDGGFVMVEPAAWERSPTRIHLVVNWVEELKAKLTSKP